MSISPFTVDEKAIIDIPTGNATVAEGEDDLSVEERAGGGNVTVTESAEVSPQPTTPDVVDVSDLFDSLADGNKTTTLATNATIQNTTLPTVSDEEVAVDAQVQNTTETDNTTSTESTV